MHDYFYGREADQFSFYRVPTVLFTDEQYKNISPEAKILYGILLKRMDLSAKNGWLDEHGRVYIIFRLEEIMEKLNCADNKATKLMDELETKAGLIEKRRQGQGKPNLIFVKNFIDSVENPASESSETRFLIRDNHDSGLVKTTDLESLKSRTSNTDNSYTDMSDTDPIYPGSEGMRTRGIIERYFKNVLEYDALLLDYPSEQETIDGIMELLTDACTTNRTTFRIAGDDRPREVVRGRLMKLNAFSIRYVLSCLRENDSDVKNIKQYLLAALYNAPTTINPYYQTKVNHDLSYGIEGD
jgi:hypothetical protein